MSESQHQAFMDILPHALARAYFQLPRRYQLLDETRILRECEPTPMWHRLRIAFWDEYHHAVDRGLRMSPQNILRGNCTAIYWHEIILTDEKAVAFITHPVPEYKLENMEMLMLSMRKMREILDVPLITPEGRVNAPILRAVMKMYECFDRRVHGMPTHKIQIDQRNLNVNTTMAQAPMTMEQLDSEVKRLEMENKKLANGPEAERTIISGGDSSGDERVVRGEAPAGEVQKKVD